MDLLKDYAHSDEEMSDDEPEKPLTIENCKSLALPSLSAGPSNPFKSENQKAPKNTLTGFVEPAHINDFHFTRELRSFDTLGYARNPTADQS
ncbi:unnamed protein product [Cylicostephanus goldi]|uniref:Uncharacterized protein n=1 Tax=Cylicostephanus goldi TaxID=71465 RepID=A0A3P7N0C2_CYLGO|nr:unnamed protein product [Cylicostephanus goldi]